MFTKCFRVQICIVSFDIESDSELRLSQIEISVLETIL